MAVFLDLATGFGVCLLLVWSFEAVRRGRGLYWPAVIGLSAHLLARLGDGYMYPRLVAVLRWGGLALAAVVVIVDLVTEEVPVEPPPAAGAPGPEPSSPQI